MNMNEVQAIEAAVQARKAKKQKGVSVLQVLIGTIIGATALVASISAIQGQRADAEQAETVQFVTTELYPILSAQYYNGGRSYAAFGGACGTVTATSFANAAGSCANSLVLSKGLRPTLPSGQNWGILAAVTANAVPVTLATPDATACALLRGALQGSVSQINPASARPTVGTCPAATPFNLTVTYNPPV